MSPLRHHQRRRKQHSRLSGSPEAVELRRLLSATIATVDGTGNNAANPEWGSAGIELLRIASSEYGDGTSSPAGIDRDNARSISNAIANQTTLVDNSRGLTDLTWLWGQFVDHDIDLTTAADPGESFDIAVPLADPYFDPFAIGTATIGLDRSVYVEGVASSDGVRQQLNTITAYIDGSVVYGSDTQRAAALRTFSGGLLKTSEGELLPFNVDGLDNAGGPSSTLFLAGDVRANENVALTAMQTILVREHNRIAGDLATNDPSLNDQQLYEQAREFVVAEMQVITFQEYLPALLGPDAISDWIEYDATVNPGITSEFSTAAYRFGHTMLSPQLQRLDSNGNADIDGNLPLRDAFFNPQQIIVHGVDSLLQGAADHVAQEIDTQVIDDVRNFLFGSPGAGGLDLASLNIQRGRDHGLADYNDTRIALGLAAAASFSDITSDIELATALETTYGSVNDVDLWVGGLAEDHLPDSSMGETFTEIIVDQFERLRDGDRFWYQNVLSGDQLRQIEDTTLADVIMRNSTVDGLQTNVFFAKGFEPVYVDLADQQTRDVDVRVNDGRLMVTDTQSGTRLVSRGVGDIGSVILRGGALSPEHLTVSAGIAADAVPMGIHFRSGGGGDSLTVQGTGRDDVISADHSRLRANSVDVIFESISDLLLSGEGGNDTITAVAPDAARVTLDGGNGNDRLQGSRNSESLFGGAGDDVLLGGEGDDQLFGGPGDDRLMGEGGSDRLIGNAGKDLLMQEGHESDRQALDGQSLFLDTQFNLRTNGNYYVNWGGANEKWIYGDTGWLFITPDGGLYQWNGSRTATGTLIASLNAEVWTDPGLLYNTPQDFQDNDRHNSLMQLARGLDRDLGLKNAVHYYENWGGRGEKWILGNDGWYFLTSNGRLFAWDGSSNASGRLIAEFDARYFLEPRLLHECDSRFASSPHHRKSF
jgi:peroxidase